MPLSPALCAALCAVKLAVAAAPLAPSPIDEDPDLAAQAELQALRPRMEALQTLHKDNQTHIALAAIAVQRAEDPVIRRFARRLLRDHRYLDHRATSLGQRMGLDLDLLSEEDGPGLVQLQAALVGLQELQGEALERAFLERVTQGHRQQLTRLARLRNELGSDPVRELVDAWIPILELHLDLSRALLPLPMSS